MWLSIFNIKSSFFKKSSSINIESRHRIKHSSVVHECKQDEDGVMKLNFTFHILHLSPHFRNIHQTGLKIVHFIQPPFLYNVIIYQFYSLIIYV